MVKPTVLIATTTRWFPNVRLAVALANARFTTGSAPSLISWEINWSKRYALATRAHSSLLPCDHALAI